MMCQAPLRVNTSDYETLPSMSQGSCLCAHFTRALPTKWVLPIGRAKHAISEGAGPRFGARGLVPWSQS